MPTVCEILMDEINPYWRYAFLDFGILFYPESGHAINA